MVEHRVNEYFLGSYLKTETERVKYYHIRPISNTCRDSLLDALGRLGEFDSYCDLYEICENNYQSITAYHSSIKDIFLSNRHRLYECIDKSSQEITRLLLNYLSSFRTFIGHLETKYTRLERKGCSFFNDYKKITAECYDKNFPYRFFYKFRNYVQHCGLPPIEIIIHEQLARDGNIDINISSSLLRDVLLKDYKEWGSKVREDLKNQPEYIELLPHLAVLQSQVELIYHSVASFEISLATNPWQIVWKLVNEVYVQYPDGVPFIGKYKNRDSERPSFLATYFPIHTMLKFEGKSRINDNPEYSNIKPILNKIRLNSENYVAVNDYVDIRQIEREA